jgi:hypothetical protein
MEDAPAEYRGNQVSDILGVETNMAVYKPLVKH